jgi:cell division protein FtsZ
MMTAEEGIEELRQKSDTVITIPNQRLLSIVPKGATLKDAFRVADEVLLHATKGISDLIMLPGLINRDFADVRTVMKDKGNALMGIGACKGEGRAAEAARAAISSPMLEDTNISGAQALLINVTGGEDISLHEVSEAVSIAVDAAGDEVNVLFGAVIDPTLNDEFKVTVIATGFGLGREKRKTLPESAKEDLSRPAYLRRKTFEESFTVRKEKELQQAANSLDIPSFIRRQL